jgi:aarF domain-containing kinase
VSAAPAAGGVYVKAGQLAVSMQAVPPTYRHELEGLQDSCLPRSFAAVNRVLLEELGAPAAGLFASFDPVAAAAASLAQVHRATLANGAAVAVKVQYSGLQAAVAADVATLTALAALAAWVFPSSDWRFVFAELRQKLASEMDFRVEAANAARTAANFAGRRDVAVPALVAHMCTKKVIVMEWVDGVKVTDVEGLRRLGLSPRRVALALLDATAEMMCVAGFVHGDLHPGNIFVRAQPSRRPPLLSLLLPWRPSPSPQLVLIDHGAYYELPPEMRLLYCQLWCAFVLNDAATAQDVATRLGGERAGRALPEVLRPRDWARMGAEERRRVQRRTGVAGQADLFRLVNEAPRALLDCLRAAAVVRHTATRLGATVADRLRVNAAQALRGLQVEAPAEGAGGRRRRRRRVVYVGAMRSRWRRWNLWARIAAMRIAAWVALAVGGGRDDAAVPLVE